MKSVVIILSPLAFIGLFIVGFAVFELFKIWRVDREKEKRIARMKARFKSVPALAMLLLAVQCSAQTNAVLVRGDLIGKTQFLHWALTTNSLSSITVLNFTNDWPPAITNFRVSYEGWGWIQASTDAVHWMNRTVYWFPYFLIANTATNQFFRAPAVPPLYPTNGPAVLPQ